MSNLVGEKSAALQRAMLVEHGALLSGNARRILRAKLARIDAQRALFNLTRAIRAAEASRNA